MSWHRLTRNLFDTVTAATDVTAAGAAEVPYGTAFAKYATWATNVINAQVSSTGKKGVKTNSTAASGGAALWGEQLGRSLRFYSAIYLPAAVNSTTGTHRSGLAVLAQDDNATPANARSVFCGLLVDPSGLNRRWVIATDSNNGLVSTEATLTATSQGTSQGITVPFKVLVSAAGVVTMRTPDGVLTADYSGSLASLGDWVGVRSVSLTSIANGPLVEAFTLAWNDPAYVRPNDAWDRVKLLPNFTPIFEWSVGSEGALTNSSGATPTYDPDDVLYGEQSIAQAANPMTTQRWDITLPTAVDLSTKALALSHKAFAPNQLAYVTTTLAAQASYGGATVQLASVTGLGPQSGGVLAPSAGVPGYLDIAAAGVGVKFTGRSGTTLTGCTWTGTDPGSPFAIGTRAAQYGGNPVIAATLEIQIAASSAERTAGNYISLKPLQTAFGNWACSTFYANGPAGLEGRTFGTATASILTSITYMRVLWTCGTALPYSGAGFDGPQPAGTPSIKWDVIGTFDKTTAPTVCFSFDDSHDSDALVVAPELEKPRPGFPNGMRATFYVIASNADTNTFTTTPQYQRLAANGHEIASHVFTKTHHSSGDAGGDGSMDHYELINPGASLADHNAEVAWITSRGIPGPATYASPYGNHDPTVLANAQAAGLRAARTLNGGGGVNPVITGSGGSADVLSLDKTSIQTRFLTEPVGDVWRLPSSIMPRDLNAGDNLGHRTSERVILEACMQGMKCIVSDHQMYPHGTPSSFSGSWSADQFGEVLDFISDLKTGGNTSGRNGAANYFPTLKVQPIIEAVTGTPVVHATIEQVGLGC